MLYLLVFLIAEIELEDMVQEVLGVILNYRCEDFFTLGRLMEREKAVIRIF